MASSTERLKGVVETIVRRQLAANLVHRIDLEPGEDSDGDPVLRIRVVLETTGKDLDDSKMVGLVRHLRSELARADEEAFPLVSFISKKEVAKLGLESV